MGLLSALKNRFFPPELCRVARTGDACAVAECIARTPVVVIGADLGVSVTLEADVDSVIAMVEAAAQKKLFDGSIYKYAYEGETFVPIFTDSAAAGSFCGAYCSLLGHIHAFRLFAVPGAYIRHWVTDHDIIVVNPQSNNEVEIDSSKSRAIREHLPKKDTFSDAQFVSLCFPIAGISQPIEFSPDT